MYEGIRTRFRTLERGANDFLIDIGLHKGSALTPFLFTIVMDELIERIKKRYHDVLYLQMT